MLIADVYQYCSLAWTTNDLQHLAINQDVVPELSHEFRQGGPRMLESRGQAHLSNRVPIAVAVVVWVVNHFVSWIRSLNIG